MPAPLNGRWPRLRWSTGSPLCMSRSRKKPDTKGNENRKSGVAPLAPPGSARHGSRECPLIKESSHWPDANCAPQRHPSPRHGRTAFCASLRKLFRAPARCYIVLRPGATSSPGPVQHRPPAGVASSPGRWSGCGKRWKNKRFAIFRHPLAGLHRPPAGCNMVGGAGLQGPGASFFPTWGVGGITAAPA